MDECRERVGNTRTRYSDHVGDHESCRAGQQTRRENVSGLPNPTYAAGVRKLV